MIGLEFTLSKDNPHFCTMTASRDFENENILPPGEKQHLLSIKCEKVNYSGIKVILMFQSL